MIQLENLTFRYNNRTALNSINVKISEGESVAVIGPNGSGKSTLLKIINGILFPNEGKFLLDSEEITEKKLNDNRFSKQFHKRIGFVFQNSDTQLFCSTVFEEVAFGPRQMGMSQEDIYKRVNDCIRLLNIDSIKNEAPYNISGGEKRRTAIASILSMNPEILTFDEPLAGIDPKGKKFLSELMIKLNNVGKTIICATHEFEYVEGLFRRAIVFSEDHRIIRDGSYNEIIQDKDFLQKNNII